VPSSTPPIANLHAPRPFPFRALAALAGRQPIGGEREVALACLMAARVASGAIGATPLPQQAREARALAARGWVASLALPAALRSAVVAVLEASEGAGPSLAGAVRALGETASPQLDAASRAELDRLAAEAERGM
jgi:hypothetical protein